MCGRAGPPARYPARQSSEANRDAQPAARAGPRARRYASRMAWLEGLWVAVKEFVVAPATLIALTSVSLVCCVVSIFVATWAVRRLPADYLLHDPDALEEPSCSRASLLLRNLFGGLLLLLGVLMLILPGQGLLTIVAALAVMSFRSKRRLEQRLLARPHVLALINRLRRRSGHPPLLVPPRPSSGTPRAPSSRREPAPGRLPPGSQPTPASALDGTAAADAPPRCRSMSSDRPRARALPGGSTRDHRPDR